ncbi:MAG TPA: arginine--tRNA ligase [Egibacteraceae bacterium]|nr:arginine--tRNA ligase [Egibacteraceae bacterium]
MITPEHLAAVVRAALAEAGLPDREPHLERPRQREHGDWATNVALTLAKETGRPPREIAQDLADRIGTAEGVEAVEVAGPGFLNFRLSHDVLQQIVRAAVTQAEAWGRTGQAAGKANVEFVSANPTGPLHVGHGRQAALGDAIASLLEATGWEVAREYYFNDAGNQMELFAASVLAAARGEAPPENGYHGAYITELAREMEAAGELADATEAAYQRMLSHITATLDKLGVRFDVYFGERELHTSGAVDRVIARLRAAGHAYDSEGAVWLRTTAFGDDKDRVLLRADGRPTYFAADCAYLGHKVDRRFDRIIFVWGADHHGYIKRVQAAAEAEGLDPDDVEFIVHQFVNLYRGGQAVRMSKRTGEMITFDELIDEVGADAARYTFLRFSNDVTIDFDIEEVVRQDRENPVYYVQYSHARITGIMRTARERGVDPGSVGQARLDLLTHSTEGELIRRIGAYPEVVAYAAAERAPHRVARYAEELAEAFHKFYTDCQVVGSDTELTRARYWLCVAARQTLVNALGLLGVGAPERM